MADKPAAPGAAEGTGRRKRPTPTIDLTATEVQSDAAERVASANEPPPAAEAAAAGDPPPESTARTAPQQEGLAERGRFGWTAVASGLAGGAVVAAVLLALWFADVLPVRYDASDALRVRIAQLESEIRDRPAAAGNKALDDLSQRVEKIETAVAKLSAGEPAVAERLAATENAVRSLGIALTALNHRSDDVAGSVAGARERADAAANAVAKLQAAVQSASPAANRTGIDALNKRIGDIEQAVRAKASADTAARLALSAALLRDAVGRGEPFTTQLAEVKSLGADATVLAPLDPFAASGVPKEADLAHALSALIPAMLKASGESTSGGFFARLQANAGNLVHIRPVDAPPGDDPADVLARIEVEAAHDDIAGAMTDISKLPAKTRAPAEAWLKKAQARQAAIDASRKLAADAAAALGKP